MHKNVYLKILGSIIAGLAGIFIYTLLHEGGHAIAAVLLGARITAFDLNFITGSPHIGWQGFVTPAGRAIIAISGPLFPFLVWLLSLAVLRWQRTVAVRRGLLIASIMAISSLLPQVITPILYLRGVDLRGEDIVGFIIYSGLHPLVVAGSFAVLVATSVWLVLKLIRPAELIKVHVAQLRSTVLTTRQRLLTGVLLLAIMLIALPMAARITSSNQRPRFPKDYDTRVQAEFSKVDTDWTSIHEFSVDETRVFDMVYSLKAVDPTSLRLITDSPKGIVFTGKDYMVLCEDVSSVSFAQYTGYALYPGNYRLEVKTTDKAGNIEMYISSKDITPDHLEFLTLLDALNQGTFTAESYQAEGYELVYQGLLTACEDKVLYTFDTSAGSLRSFKTSVFVAGEYNGLTVTYVDSAGKQPLLTNSRATMGFGITPRAPLGEFVLSSTAAAGELYIYVKR